MLSSSATEGSSLLQCSATRLDSSTLLLTASLAVLLVWTVSLGLGRSAGDGNEDGDDNEDYDDDEGVATEYDAVMALPRSRSAVLQVASLPPALLLPGQDGGHCFCPGPAPPDHR